MIILPIIFSALFLFYITWFIVQRNRTYKEVFCKECKYYIPKDSWRTDYEYLCGHNPEAETIFIKTPIETKNDVSLHYDLCIEKNKDNQCKHYKYKIEWLGTITVGIITVLLWLMYFNMK